MAYICERKGLPKPADQRAALAAAGLTAEELADPYLDRCMRKPRPGERPQPERDHIIGAAREGDEVWVARLGVLATTSDEAMRFVASVCDQGAVLCCASTGRRYRVRSEAAQDVADALRLAADIAADERRAVMERARKGLRGKPAGKPKIGGERLEAARVHWFDATIGGDEAARRAGVGRRTLHRHFGPRETPAFGGKRKGRK